MMSETADAMERLASAHAALKAEGLTRLRALSMEQRSTLIEAACEAAVLILRSRAEAGLPPAAPAPWPASTRAFFKRHAARVRT